MPKSIRDLMPQALQQASASRATLDSVRAAWTAVVGRSLARHARPTSLRKAVLYVQADDPGVSFLLNLKRLPLLQRMREQSGQVIEDMVVRPGTPGGAR